MPVTGTAARVARRFADRTGAVVLHTPGSYTSICSPSASPCTVTTAEIEPLVAEKAEIVPGSLRFGEVAVDQATNEVPFTAELQGGGTLNGTVVINAVSDGTKVEAYSLTRVEHVALENGKRRTVLMGSRRR